jgi:hypothetical protein
LYDFFMAQPPLMPVYLAAAIVLYKKVGCQMKILAWASAHFFPGRAKKILFFSKSLKHTIFGRPWGAKAP